MSEIDYQCD